MKHNVICNIALAFSVLATPALAATSQLEVNDNELASTPRTAVTAEGDGAGDGQTSEKRSWHHKFPFSDDQLEKIAALKDQYMQKTASQHDQVKLLHRQLQEAMAKQDVDRTQAQQILSQINSIHADLASKHLDYRLDFMALLTPEQREHWRKHMLIENAFGGGHHHRHGGHEHGHGHDGGHEHGRDGGGGSTS